jgi:hypothetical protein
MQMLDRLSGSAGPWGRVVSKITRWGIVGRNKLGQNRMLEAYDRLICEAEKLGRPREEIDGFRRARETQAAIRRAIVRTVQLAQKGRTKKTGSRRKAGNYGLPDVSGAEAVHSGILPEIENGVGAGEELHSLPETAGADSLEGSPFGTEADGNFRRDANPTTGSAVGADATTSW